MPTTTADINQIKQIAWVLSLAGATDQLDVPGEYIWAYPLSSGFEHVRLRTHGIFSSGNSIKDPEVTEFVQNQNINRHLVNPWVVQEFEQQFKSWISSGTRYRLHNFDLFRYTGFSAGSQESFINLYLVNKDRRFRIFKGDYWWHIDIWNSVGISWAFIEDDDLKPNDICICSYPFALTGDKHQNFDWLVDECNRVGIKLLVDFIYLPNSNNAVDIDLSAECIEQITFSLSKTFPVQCAKIAVRMCKNKPSDPLQISNDENICNRLGAGLALDIINAFPVDYNVTKYQDQQQYWCNKLGLIATKVVHFGRGDDYTSIGRADNHTWVSAYNQQKNRYNLGMLFENQNLLKKLELY